jgi:hypothetical protein
MSARYSYDYSNQKSNYTTLQNVSKYIGGSTCISPSSPLYSRSQRDLDDYKTYVIDKNQTTENYSYCNNCGCNRKNQTLIPNKSIKENFCTCSGGNCPLKFQCQHFNRNLNQIEQDYVSGKYTEYNFATK